MLTRIRVLLTPVVLSGGLLLTAVPPSMAQAGGVGPCQPEAQKFCKDVQPGQGRIRDCLKQHSDDLSAACKKHVESGQWPGQAGRRGGAAGGGGFFAVCKADLEKHCKGVKQGEGRLLACLRSHASEIAPECKAQLGGGPAAPAPPAKK